MTSPKSSKKRLYEFVGGPKDGELFYTDGNPVIHFPVRPRLSLKLADNFDISQKFKVHTYRLKDDKYYFDGSNN
jgi:hypothetical protein